MTSASTTDALGRSDRQEVPRSARIAHGDERQTPGQIAEVLVATLCEGVSLGVWRDAGILKREWSALQRLGVRYGRLVLVTEGDAQDRQIASDLPCDRHVELVVNQRKLDRAAFLPEAVDRILASVGDSASAVVRTEQFWGGELALAATRALRERGVRTGLVARGGYPWSRFVAWECGPDSAQAGEAASIERMLCQAADVVVGTTERMLDDVRWRYGLGHERTVLVPNFIASEASVAPGVAREPGTVLFAGRLASQKRVGLLIDAVGLASELVGAAVPGRIRLRIVGDGDQRDDLRARASDVASRTGVEIEFLPRMGQRDLVDQMRRCAVYAQASAYEGHPKVVLEALACGTPVVLTDAPGLSDVVVGGVTGVVTRGTSESLASGLAAVLGDERFAARLGLAGAASVDTLRPERTLDAEASAHESAIARAGDGTSGSPGAVRWDPELLDADAQTACAAWARSLHGYSRRLPPDRRAVFCASVETPFYDVIDRAALELGDGVHPKHHLMRYHDFFVDRIRACDRVLDLGCGYGAVARSIVERAGASVTGMDFSASNAAQAREMARASGLEGRMQILEGDITRDQAIGHDGSSRFDVIVLSNVLEHLADRERLLERYVRWYEPRTVLIRVPAFDRNWQTAWKAELGVDSRCDDTHETEYTEAGLRAELDASGLRVVELISRWGEYWVRAEPMGETDR